MRLAFNGTYLLSNPFGTHDPTAYANYPGKNHPGTDWALPENTPLVAGMSGQVTVYRRIGTFGRGNEVVITNGNMERKTCHMNRIDVVDGQFVKEGDPIGLSGNTGYSTGPHLHDELLIDGKYVDVSEHITGRITMNEAEVKRIYHSGWRRPTASDELKRWVGKDAHSITFPYLVDQFDHVWAELVKTQAELAKAKKQIDAVKELLKG